MSDPQGPQAVQVGVLLARQPDDLGEWLAEGAAFDAAGAAALWIDLATDPEHDRLVLTAALAAVTMRSLLVTSVPPGLGAVPDALADMLATIGRLSRGRLRIVANNGSIALAGVGRDLGVFRRVPGDPEEYEHTRRSGETERWVATALPGNRALWRETLAHAAEAGARGLLVPADSRLLDLLRNPDDPGPRRDLQLAQG